MAPPGLANASNAIWNYIILILVLEKTVKQPVSPMNFWNWFQFALTDPLDDLFVAYGKG